MSEQEDLFYIDQITNGQTAVYAELVNQYKDKAYTLALRVVRNQEDAEEVAQDAFLKAFKGLKNFKREASFSTWLYRIVYNTALSKIKKKQLETAELNEAHYNYSSSGSLESMAGLVQADRVMYVQKAINELSEEEALLVNLYYTHEKDMHEIAQITDLTHVNVRVKLSRIRGKLEGIFTRLLKKEIKDIV